jgi:GLE1-like protein
VVSWETSEAALCVCKCCAACRLIKEGDSAGQLEGAEAFIKQTRGLLRFYGAVLQYQDVPAAWTYVAFLANTLPANVYSGTALVAFLETAGHALSLRYGRQFHKVLQVRDSHVLARCCTTSRPHSREARCAQADVLGRTAFAKPHRFMASCMGSLNGAPGVHVCRQHLLLTLRSSTQAIASSWLPVLERDRQAEAASVRLKSYCTEGFPDAPEGLELLEDVEDVEAARQQRGGGQSRGYQGNNRGDYDRRR